MEKQQVSYEWNYSAENINWEELAELFRIAPFGDKRAEDIEKAFKNSMFKCFIFEQDKLIGVGRALADGIDCSYICDVAVHPEYQGTGLGRAIITKLLDFSEGHKKIILYACPGKEGFYNKFGFKQMNTAMAIFENQDQAMASGLVCTA